VTGEICDTPVGCGRVRGTNTSRWSARRRESYDTSETQRDRRGITFPGDESELRGKMPIPGGHVTYIEGEEGEIETDNVGRQALLLSVERVWRKCGLQLSNSTRQHSGSFACGGPSRGKRDRERERRKVEGVWVT
jgi:hypothetical protein